MNPRTLGVIREFKTRHFHVIIDALEDWDLDLSFDDDGEIRAGLESGKYVHFCARARVLYHGVALASDYLGGCIYHSIDEFQDHRECGAETRRLRSGGDKTVVCGSYFADMVSTVCKEARAELLNFRAVRVRV